MRVSNQSLSSSPLHETRPEPDSRLALQLLSAAFESLPDGLFLFNSDRRLNFINRAGQQLENPAKGWPLGRVCCEMFWGNGSKGCLVDRALAEGRLVEVETQVAAPYEKTIVLLVVPVQAQDYAVSQARHAVVIARDITQLRRVQASVQGEKAFRSSLADRAPDEIYTLDLEGRITWMNARAEAANISLPSGMLNRNFSGLVVPEAREMVKQMMQRTLAGEDTNAEFRLGRANRALQDVEAHVSPLWKDGQVIGVLIFLRDLTERKLIQERIAQSDKLRAVGELAAGVTHNINNSLTIIQGNTQLLQRRTTDSTILKGLNSIHQASLEAGQTLRRILDFARRDNDADFMPLGLAELISSSVEIARPKWQRKDGGAINVIVENLGTPYVLGIQAEIREVVLNFIFNAVDAMPDGGTIETGCRSEIDSACFWVADTGCGMKQETIARIFEPFYTTKGQKGTGLGLSASYGIIERHGGQIVVVSEPGEGTRFEVRLPLYDDASDLTHNNPTKKNRLFFVNDDGATAIR